MNEEKYRVQKFEYEKYHNKSNDYDYRWYEEIFNKHKINLQKVHYP